MQILFPNIGKGNNFPFRIRLKLRIFISDAGDSKEEKDQYAKKIN
jgi:hypothetical protein